MQNKGLVKLFALLFGLVSVFQLSFTIKSNQIESNASDFAIEKISNDEIDFDQIYKPKETLLEKDTDCSEKAYESVQRSQRCLMGITIQTEN